jgi:hypothetical protein
LRFFGAFFFDEVAISNLSVSLTTYQHQVLLQISCRKSCLQGIQACLRQTRIQGFKGPSVSALPEKKPFWPVQYDCFRFGHLLVVLVKIRAQRTRLWFTPGRG